MPELIEVIIPPIGEDHDPKTMDSGENTNDTTRSYPREPCLIKVNGKTKVSKKTKGAYPK